MSLWLKTLIGYMLIVSVAMQMLPDGKYEQYVRLFTGFLLIVLVLQPVLKIGSADSFLENQITAFVQEQEHLEKQIGIQSESFRRESEERQQKASKEIEVPEIDPIRVEVSGND